MEQVGPGEIMPRRRAIDRTFSWGRIDAILTALQREAQSIADQSEWSARTAQTISAKSPTSLVLALAQMRYGRVHGFEACMAAEFRIVSRIVYGRDMVEGIRAVIVDKDNAPRWSPVDPGAGSEDLIARHFAALQGNELDV
jgi:enoyl-CoA hydratase